MPNLNAIDTVGDISEEEFVRLLNQITRESMEAIEAGTNIDIRGLYTTESRSIILKAMKEAVTIGLGARIIISDEDDLAQYYLHTEYKGSTLSKRLYRDSIKAQRIVESTIKKHIQNKTTWLRLTKDIKKKKILNEDLPQYIKDVENSFKAGDVKGLKTSLRKAERNIKRFLDKDGITSSNLKRAYSDVVKAAVAGDTARLERKIREAVDKKAINNSQRLARSELSRAYMDAELRRIQDDSDMIGYRSVLSPNHPRPDICDFMAQADQYGMGAGVFPKSNGSPVPHHANCICMIQGVIRQDGDRTGRHSHERVKSWLNGLKGGGAKDQKKLKAIMGVEGSKHINEWEKYMKGWQGEQNLSPLPAQYTSRKGE